MARHFPITVISLGRSHYLMIGRQPLGKVDRSAFMVRWLWDGSRKGRDFYIPRRRSR